MTNEVVKKYYSEKRAKFKLTFTYLDDDDELYELLDQEEALMQKVADLDRLKAERLVAILQKLHRLYFKIN